jgi:hypothetical protein
MTAASSNREQARTARLSPMWLLYGSDAGLLIASGLIHLNLWDIAYRHVKTLDWLFLAQVILTLLTALVLLVTRHLLVIAGAAMLMAGTITGFVLARAVGIFGFRLTFISTEAYAVLVVEAVAIIMLGITAWLRLRRRAGGRA